MVTYSRRDIGTDHAEVLLTGEMVRQKMGKALASFDQPSMNGLNTWFVAGAAREAGLTVALSGLGGDELFGGYDGYRKAILAERCRPLTGLSPAVLGKAVSWLLDRYGKGEATRRAGELLCTQCHPYFLTRRLFSTWQVNRLLALEVLRDSAWMDLAFRSIEAEAAGYDPINRASAFELQTYMLSTLLRDTDQMSMAHALEVRVPLIDHRLVEFLFTLPGRVKLDRRQPKPLLTRPLKGMIPDACIQLESGMGSVCVEAVDGGSWSILIINLQEWQLKRRNRCAAFM